jgi:hypothetical protein
MNVFSFLAGKEQPPAETCFHRENQIGLTGHVVYVLPGRNRHKSLFQYDLLPRFPALRLIFALSAFWIRACGQELRKQLRQNNLWTVKGGLLVKDAPGYLFKSAAHTCFRAGIQPLYVLPGRNIRVCGQEYTCFRAGIYGSVGRNRRASGQEIRRKSLRGKDFSCPYFFTWFTLKTTTQPQRQAITSSVKVVAL